MKKKSLKIDLFRIKSFITDTQKNRLTGGLKNDAEKTSSNWRDCTYINCPDTF